MKKLVFVVSLMTVLFLVSCNGGDKPATKEYTLSIVLDNCKIGVESTTYIKKYSSGATIDSIAVTPLDGYTLTENSVSSSYKQYWSKSDTAETWLFSGLTMSGNRKFKISATESCTLTIELKNCKIGNATTYTKTYLKDSIIDPVTVEPNDDLILTSDSVSKNYKDYWSFDGKWTFSGLVMNQNHTVTINAGYMLTTATQDITIYPSLIIPNEKYEGEIFINDESLCTKFLPLSLVSGSVVLDDTTDTDITDKCIYEVKDDNANSCFEIPADSTTGNIAVNLTLKDAATAKWYDFVNWWNYCSTQQGNISIASKTDVGQIVYAEVYGLMHKIRLIDVDHIGADGVNPEAHCTFEFANVITDSNGAVKTHWHDKKNNYDFPNSTLNNLLNNTEQENCIFNKLPIGLQGAIKEVDKKVGITSSYSTDTPYQTKLFPLAHDEMTNHEDGVPDGEGTKYQYYVDHPDQTDRIKNVVGGNAIQYFFRSPGTSHSYHAWYVSSDGRLYFSYGAYDYAFAVAPAFCV